MVDTDGLPPDLLLQELGWVRELARSLLRNDALADDVVQETWLAASRQPAGTVQRVRPWLASIVQNQVRRLVRGMRRRTAREHAVANAAAESTSADVAARGALYRELTEAVMALDPPLRDAVLLRHLDGLSGPEVAARLGIGHGAARQRIARGLARLRERLDKGHAGGFAAWSAAWTHHLGAATPAASAAASSALPAFFTLVMNAKWLSAAVGGVLAVGLWLAWPAAPSAPPSPHATTDRGSVAASSAPARPPAADATDRTVAPAADRALTVVDAAGAPVPDVHVFALRGGALQTRAVTDATGAVRVPTPAEWDALLLATASRMPLRVAATDVPATRRIVLAAGERVAGRVRLPAGREVELLVAHDAAPAWASGLDAATLAALASLGIAPQELRVTLPPDGTFDVRGLDRTWSGSVALADGWTLRSSDPHWRVRTGAPLLLVEPATDIDVIAVPPLTVHGRLLIAGQPAAGIPVTSYWGEWPDDRSSSAVSAADGRFVLAVGHDLDFRRMVPLMIGAHFERERMVEIQPDTVDVDTGDIELGRPLRVRVQRPDGTPIADAELVVRGARSSTIAGHTGADGHASLPFVAPDAKQLLVMATGHASVRAKIPAAGELTVELVPCSSLAITVDAPPALLRDLQLRVQAADVPFGPPTGDAPKPFDLTFAFERAGHRMLDNLRPGALLRLGVIDGQGAEIESRDVAAPPIGRCDQVKFTVTDRLKFLRGTVRDERGRPIARATLRLEIGGEQEHARTGTDGRFELGPMRAAVADAHLEVEHPQFVPIVRHPFAADPDAGDLDFTLLRGRDVRAIVAQANGQPVTGATVLLTFADQATGLGEEREPGNYLLENVAPRPGQLKVLLSGREYTTPVGAADTTAQLVVPDLATVTVPFPAGEDGAAERRISLVVTPLEPAGDENRQYFRRPTDGVVAPLQLQLPPGRYRLRLEALVGRGRFDAVGAPQEIVAVGGSVAQIVLQ